MVHTFFDYGNVYIQTAGEKERFVFKDVGRPERVREDILRLVEADKKRHGYVKTMQALKIAAQKNTRL